jgi:branched-chain amino acid transport system ATP-binding protein
LVRSPKIILLDEPFEGLAPILVHDLLATCRALAEGGQTILVVEQNITAALTLADRVYVIVHGKIAFEGGSAAELNNNELVRKFYLGL